MSKCAVFSFVKDRGLLRQTVRQVSSWKKRIERQKELEKVVVQYAGKNSKPASRVYVWGYAATGALGVRRFLRPEKKQYVRTKQLQPHRLDFFDNISLKVVDACCGYGFSLFVCEGKDGKFLYGTGINTDSQLGYVEYPRNSVRILDYMIEPVPVHLPLLAPANTRVSAVAAGRAHVVIATDNEGVFSLGNNAYGQCGRTIVEDEIFRGSQQINKIEVEGRIKQIACGQDHTLFLTEEGKVYSCGLGSDGQTGLGHYDCCDKPTLVRGDIDGEKIIHITSKGDCVLAVNDSGDVFGWGNSEYEQLGAADSDKTQINSPRRLPFSEVGRAVQVAASGAMCALLNDAGNVYVWGFGILGKGPRLSRSFSPTMIPPPLFGRNEFNRDERVTSIQAGMNYFAAISNQGNLYTWGRNKQASLGLGHRLDQFFPFKVQVGAEVKQVVCGVDHTVALCKTFA